MRTRLLSTLFALAFPLLLGVAVQAANVHAPATGPDPREIPLPVINTPLGKMPGVNELPVRRELPDIMTMNDGTKVITLAQWKKRREEIKRILQYYATGAMPPAPGNVKGWELKSETVLNNTVRYRLVHLTFGPEEKLGLDIGIFTPMQGGPFPTVILQSGTPPYATPLPDLPKGPGEGRPLDILLVTGSDYHPSWPPRSTRPPVGPPGAFGRGGRGAAGPMDTPAEMIARSRSDLFRRGYALAVYNNTDCAEDTTLREKDGTFSFRTTRFLPAYPGYDWGILAVWAWGASRVADYLETDPSIDATKLIITGASRNGKAAMIASAFDDRLMGAPVVTGGGGMAAYRASGPRDSQTLDDMQQKFNNWFGPNLHQFWGQREKLPFDQHWFVALTAPKPFISLEGMADTLNLPMGVKATLDGARPAYALYGKPDAIGVNFAEHGHAFTEVDWNAMLDFADKHYRGMKVDRSFDRYPTDAELDAIQQTARPPAPRPPASPPAASTK
jgi:hypothetical protein